MKCDECDYGECGCGTIVGEDVSSLGRLVLGSKPGEGKISDRFSSDAGAGPFSQKNVESIRTMLMYQLAGFIWDDDDGMPPHNSMPLVWSYSSPIRDAEFEDLEDDVDDIPPTKPSIYSWFVYSFGPKKLALVEAMGRDQAAIFVNDEFGLDGKFLIPTNHVDLRSALAAYSLTEADLTRNSEYTIWSRTKDRKVLRSQHDGLNCISCGNFYQMAVANLPAGKLKCYSCKVR